MNQEPNEQINSRIAVFCIGNILMLDEGLGPRVAAELAARFAFAPAVPIFDRGTMGMALLAEIKQYDVILVIDAVDNTGFAPGTVVTFAPEEVAAYQAFHGAHDTRLIDVLQAAALLGHQIQGQCLGIQVANMLPASYTIGLTPPVEDALPLLFHAALTFLAERGVLIHDKLSGKTWSGERVEPALAATFGFNR